MCRCYSSNRFSTLKFARLNSCRVRSPLDEKCYLCTCKEINYVMWNIRTMLIHHIWVPKITRDTTKPLCIGLGLITNLIWKLFATISLWWRTSNSSSSRKTFTTRKMGFVGSKECDGSIFQRLYLGSTDLFSCLIKLWKECTPLKAQLQFSTIRLWLRISTGLTPK